MEIVSKLVIIVKLQIAQKSYHNQSHLNSLRRPRLQRQHAELSILNNIEWSKIVHKHNHSCMTQHYYYYIANDTK